MKQVIVKERWKTFPLDLRYQVSNLGRVRRKANKRIRKTPIKQNGYPGLVFTAPGIRYAKGYDLHMLVAITWLGPRPEKYDVSHLDGNKRNNCVSNLRYESRKENANKAFNNFDRSKNKKIYKLTLKQVKEIIADKTLTNVQWAALLNVCRVTIWKIRTGVTWKSFL